MRAKLDYTEAYITMNCMYKDEIVRLMNEMGDDLIKTDIFDIMLNDDKCDVKVIMDNEVYDIPENSPDKWKSLYDFVYERYEKWRSPTLIDKLKEMSFERIRTFLIELGVINNDFNNTDLVEMNDNSTWWDKYLSKIAFSYLMDMIIYSHDYGDFRTFDNYILIENRTDGLFFHSFGTVPEIVNYFEDEIHENCTDEYLAQFLNEKD